MNRHLKSHEIKFDSLGKPARPMPDVRPEGRYSMGGMVRVSLREIDGSELFGKAVLAMGADGRPEKLKVRGGMLPNGNLLIARSGNAEYMLALEEEGKDLAVKMHTVCGGTMVVHEFKIASAMRISGDQKAKDDPESWADVAAEGELEELKSELEGVLSGKASALTRGEVLGARFKFTDGSEVDGRVLFGEGASIQPGCIKSEWEKGKARLVDALRVRGEAGRMGCFLIKGNLQCVADISAAFTDVAKNPQAFVAEIGGHRYAGVIA